MAETWSMSWLDLLVYVHTRRLRVQKVVQQKSRNIVSQTSANLSPALAELAFAQIKILWLLQVHTFLIVQYLHLNKQELHKLYVRDCICLKVTARM